MSRLVWFSLVGLILLVPAAKSYADTFGTGQSTFEIEFVTIGAPGNPPDTTGNPNPAGSVPYSYRIGKYEISREMIDKANVLGGLGITMTQFGDSNDDPSKPAVKLTGLRRIAL